MYSYVGNNPINRTDPSGMSYFIGSGTNDPFIRENEYRVDGFDMSPQGTASNLTDESMLSYAPNSFLLNEGMPSSTSSGEPQEPNPPTINNSGAAAQSCSIEISFSGSYDGYLLNGPSQPQAGKDQLYGIGFSVKISGLSGDVALRSSSTDPKPRNTWLVEQWVADFNFKNGKVELHDTVARMDKLAIAVPRPRRDGNSVSWYDHPGTFAAGTQWYFTKRNFYIKAYNGTRHCEVAFHLTFTVFNKVFTNPGWGPGPYN